MLIFDSFPSVDAANAFCRAVTEKGLGLQVWLYHSAADAQERDPFPGELVPPIVHVERPYDGDDLDILTARSEGLGDDTRTAEEIERELGELVVGFAGVFVGT